MKPDVQANIDNCKDDLNKIWHLIEGIGTINPISGYLTRFALIRICGTLEVCYKSIIADYYEAFSPELQRYIGIHVREASLNAQYNSISKVLGEFSEEKCRLFKTRISSLENKEQVITAMSDLNTARNEVAHGYSTTMSFNEMKQKFNDSLIIIDNLCEVLS